MTKKLIDYGYKTEKDFIKNAAVDPQVREKFKEYIRSYSAVIADLFIKKNNLPERYYHTLTEVGMTVFDKAFNSYLSKSNAYSNEVGSYKFSTYFVYWVEKAIKDEMDK